MLSNLTKCARKSEEMRQKHNMISQKGRQRINEEINKLKQILPECRDVECNKAAVLQCAVKNLEKFTKCTSSLWMAVQNLEKETKRLWDTCQDLAGELSQATDRPFEDILEQYTIEPPASMVEQSNIKFGDDMPIPPPTKRQRHQDDIIDDCWSAPLEPY